MKELIVIQSKLKVAKSNFNYFGKYNYRSCEDILEALKPLLKEQNCFLVASDEILFIGNRFYVKSVATISNSEGLQISSYGLAREEESKKGMDGAQVTGASSSYARKYALNGLFAIDDSKDADATNDGKKEESKKQSVISDTKFTEDQYNTLYQSFSESDVLRFLKYHSPERHPESITPAVKKWLVEKHDSLYNSFQKWIEETGFKIATKNEEK